MDLNGVICEKQKCGRKKDNIRSYYMFKDNKLCCTIKDCNKTFSSKTSITALKCHILNHDQNINININANNNNDNTLMNIVDSDEIMIYKTFAVAFAKKSLPYSLVEDHYFRKAISCLNSKYTLTRCKLKEFVIEESNNVKENTLTMLSTNRQHITLAIDGWTNVRSNKVTNILLICSGIPYYYTSIENKYSANTAEYLTEILNEKINFLLNKGLRIIAITSDNENLMKLTRRNLIKLHPILITIPCSAHIIQLCFKSICSVENINKIINETIEIVKSIRNNKKNRVKLQELQKEENVNQQLKLIYPVEIRWTSLILCLERLFSLRKYIDQLNLSLTNNYWDNLRDVYILLKPFKEAINSIQNNSATLYSVWINFNSIVKTYKNSQNIPHNFKDVVLIITDVIINKWNKHINRDLIESVRLFNLEQNFKYNKKTLEFIVTWGQIYLKTYNIINDDSENNDDENVLAETIRLQLNEFISRHNEFALINSEHEKLKKKYNCENKHYDIKLLWNLYMPSHYELTNIAMAILSICPSEASVERSFSMQSDVHSLERNKLSEELIEAEMTIKMNLK